MTSILYVWMPTEKIYPGGPIYLADYVHKKTDAEQKILDLSLIDKKDRMKKLRQEIDTFDPDIIAFSWRNIQLFSPKQDDPSLENAFKFLYSQNPLDKITAALFGVKSILRSVTNTQETVGYINKTRESYDKKIIVGGAAFSVFPDQIIAKLKEGIIGITGEGEDVILKIIEGREKEELLDERIVYRKGKEIVKGEQKEYVKMEDFTHLDFEYIKEAFPQFKEYENRYIGIQTKRGCPYGCIFCSYPFIEGKRLRFKKPDILAEEVLTLHQNYGIKKFWFTDSNFISAKKTIPHCNEFLRRIIQRGADIEWGGYIRIDFINQELAKNMVDSGIKHFELSLTSGSQRVADFMHMGFKLKNVYRACEMIKDAGYNNQEVIINYSLNAPTETKESLQESIDTYRKICGYFGEENVKPYLFFLGIQPHTRLEEYAIENKMISPDYNPLAITPGNAKKLIYNPPPFNKLIAMIYLGVMKKQDRRENIGKHVLLELEEKLKRP